MRPLPLLALAKALALTLPLATAVSAQDEAPALVSGPAAGFPLHPISVYAERGPFAGQEFNAAEKVGDAPAAFLFIHDLSRNTAPVIRELDRLGKDHAVLGFEWFSIILNADRTEGENLLKCVNGSLRLHRPMILSLDGLEGPGDYALNRRCTLTLVLAKEGKVTESIALTDTGPGDFPKLHAWVESVAGSIPEDESTLRDLIEDRLPEDHQALRWLAVDQTVELRRLRQRLAETLEMSRGQGMMRQRPGQNRPDRGQSERGNAARGEGSPDENLDRPQREGRPPEDPELNQALQQFIRKTNDDARADEIMKSIEARAAKSAALRSEAVEMFKLMLSFPDRYGTAYAQKLAESFLKDHAESSSPE